MDGGNPISEMCVNVGSDFGFKRFTRKIVMPQGSHVQAVPLPLLYACIVS